jgi:hypothetical protein
MVMLDTVAYHIDLVRQCDRWLGGGADPFTSMYEAWPDGSWTFQKGDSSVMLESVPVDEGKTCRASFQYTGVLDMDYIASVRPICKTKSQSVSSDYVDMLSTSWCIDWEAVSFPTLNVLDETCNRPQYQQALCNLPL